MRLFLRILLVVVVLLLAAPRFAGAQALEGTGDANSYLLAVQYQPGNSSTANNYDNAYAYCSAPGLSTSVLGGTYIAFGVERDTGNVVAGSIQYGETDMGYTAGQYLPSYVYSGIYVHNLANYDQATTVDFYPLPNVSATASHGFYLNGESANGNLVDTYVDAVSQVTGLTQPGASSFQMDTFLSSAEQPYYDSQSTTEMNSPEFNNFTNGSTCAAQQYAKTQSSGYQLWPGPGSSQINIIEKVPALQPNATTTYTDSGEPVMTVSAGSIPTVPVSPPRLSLPRAGVRTPYYSGNSSYYVAARMSIASAMRSFLGSPRVRSISVEKYATALPKYAAKRTDVNGSRLVYSAIVDLNLPTRVGNSIFRRGVWTYIIDAESKQLLQAHLVSPHASNQPG